MLRDELRRQGDFLFRWRSFLPLMLLPLAVVAASKAGYLEAWLGDPLEELWEIVCVMISFAGLAVRGATVGFVPGATSGRNTREQRAAVLNTTGMYSVVRNPLYLGNYLIMLGIVLLPAVWWLVTLATLAFMLYYERIIYAEEAFLDRKFGAAYRTWAARTPMMIPNVRLWRPSDLPFSLRTVLRREYNGFYVVVGSLTLIELACDTLGEGERLMEWAIEDYLWVVFFAVGTVLFLLLRALKRHTILLKAPGR